MSELTIAECNYRTGKMNALQQFHVTRRLGPMLAVAGVTVEMMRNRQSEGDLDSLMGAMPHIMELLARMKDEDVNYVLFTCLSVVQRQQGDAWAQVIAPDGKTIMFADIDMPTMIRIVFEVLMENLANFLKEPTAALGSQSTSGVGVH